MNALLDALSISVMSLIIAFAVFILIMLAMYASAAILGRQREPASAPAQSTAAPAVAPSAPTVHAEQTDQEHVAAIMAALEAAEVSIPAGGRIRIEKVPRRS